MGKTGPCCHCGVTSTPLWRNGPPEKPVLCNACGSRWRTKGSLTNYTPLHAREFFEAEETKVLKIKSISNPKEQKAHKKKQNNSAIEFEPDLQYCDQNFRRIAKRDNGHLSSARSAISNSESCGHAGVVDATDMTGSAQSNGWEPQGPSKKRIFVTFRNSSPVEKLTKDLYSIWHEQQSCNMSGSSEDDLVYQSLTPLDTSEIGYGTLLIKLPSSRAVEDESEASSLPVESRPCTISEVYSGSTHLPVNCESKGSSFENTRVDKLKNSTVQIAEDNAKRDKKFHEKFKIVQDEDSPLNSSVLSDVINFEVFMKYFSHEERKCLMKFLPSIETLRSPESIKSIFRSPQFFKTISYFQKLLQEGTFDESFTRAYAEEYNILKSYILDNLAKRKCVENYEMLKDAIDKPNEEMPAKQSSSVLAKLASRKRPHDRQKRSYSALKGAMRSPKRAYLFGASNILSKSSSKLNSCDAGSLLLDDVGGFVDNDGICLSPSSLFASPERHSLLAPLQFTVDNDLLVDVPSSASFPEAELLHHPWKGKSTQNGSVAESGVADGEESLTNFPSSSFSNKQATHR